SRAAVDALRRRLDGEVRQASVTELPFDDEAFDAAVLGEVLEHVEDDRGALAAALRRLAAEEETTGRIAAAGHAVYRKQASEDVLGRRWRGILEGLM
ncbi:MAG TPA: methyltransferase domain-containing protein, partial [Gaiellaceae bacterium]|nr:methyltransferase domain-containing protein [Gaiellaceae bacterium]